MVGEEGELVFAVRVVRLEGVPQEPDVFLFRGLEGERQVVGGRFFAPDEGEGGLDHCLREVPLLFSKIQNGGDSIKRARCFRAREF